MKKQVYLNIFDIGYRGNFAWAGFEKTLLSDFYVISEVQKKAFIENQEKIDALFEGRNQDGIPFEKLNKALLEVEKSMNEHFEKWKLTGSSPFSNRTLHLEVLVKRKDKEVLRSES